MVAFSSLTSLCASERDRPEKVPDLQILNLRYNSDFESCEDYQPQIFGYG
jgi:hypothetical protein